MRWNSKHLLILYKREGNPAKDMPFDRYAASTHPERTAYKDTGWFAVWKELIKQKVLGRVTVVIETNRHCGQADLTPHIKLMCMPDIGLLGKLLYHDALPGKNIVFMAHGYVPEWQSFFDTWHGYNRWILRYPNQYNDPHTTIAYGDVVLDETILDPTRIGDKIVWPITRPINDAIFYPPVRAVRASRDLCIGNVSILPEKTYKALVPVLTEYRNLYGRELQTVMYSSDDKKARLLFINSLAYLHIADGQRSDPGPLEAMACGCPVLFASNLDPGPVVTADAEFCSPVDLSNPQEAARTINGMIERSKQWKFRPGVHEFYARHNDIDLVAIPQLATLFRYLFAKNQIDINGLWSVDHGRPTEISTND